MSNDSMGNLEKLGILVIVILVVVVGVVAITPSETLLGGEGTAVLPSQGGEVAPLPLPAERPAERPVAQIPDEPVLPDWPIDEPELDDPIDTPKPIETHGNVPQPVFVEPQPVAPVTPPAEPRFREITVRKGDNLWRIAERELGNGAHWNRIAAANPSVDPDRLREGMTLRIPTGTGGASASPAATPPASGGGTRTYVVQKGDTPMGLSTKFYGTVRHYRDLLRHNRLDEDGLQAGMTIEVPALAETSADPGPASAAASGPGAAADGRTYEVRKGDNPSKIAAEQLGDASRWREILELNGIASARELPAGRRIRLPE